MNDLFDIEQMANDAPETHERHKTCAFIGCSKDSEHTIKFTDSVRDASTAVCLSCFERYKRERPKFILMRVGDSLFVEKLRWE